MELTLKMRHLAPTCPDTLRSYPFVEQDPFVIQRFPHVYFAGNQPAYGEKVLATHQTENTKSTIKIVTVPRFRETGSIVLLDLKTLETFEVQLLGHDSVKKEVAGPTEDVVMIETASNAS